MEPKSFYVLVVWIVQHNLDKKSVLFVYDIIVIVKS